MQSRKSDRNCSPWVLAGICSVMLLAAAPIATAQDAGGAPPPATFTADQDHQNMMDQLGIKALRPGPSGDEKAPNHANYDESLANPYPNLPDVLTLKNGQKVTTADQWWKQRRPEIVEDFEREVYGRVPKNAPKVTWTVTVTDHEFVGFFTPVIAKNLIGHVDNAAYPQIDEYTHDRCGAGERQGPGAAVDDVRADGLAESDPAAPRGHGADQCGA